MTDDFEFTVKLTYFIDELCDIVDFVVNCHPDVIGCAAEGVAVMAEAAVAAMSGWPKRQPQKE